MDVPIVRLTELSFEELLSPIQAKPIQAAASAGNPVVLYSKSLNLGSTDDLNFEVLKDLRTLTSWLKPAVIEESLSWSALDGHHSYLELPVPLTEASLEALVERIFRIQECLGQKLCIRNLVNPPHFVGAEFTQAEFLFELARITGCEIALDHAAPDLSAYQILPSNFIRLHRLPVNIPAGYEVTGDFVIYGGSPEEQAAAADRIKRVNVVSEPINRLELEALPRREVDLKEGVFENEPRKVLLDEVTRGFGIRAQADLAIFEPTPDPRNALSTFNQQYFIQVRNILQAQYRSIAFILSGQFDRIVVDYLIQYPPAEAYLTSVGRDFEYFLRENSELPNNEMLGDLARLEYSLFEIMEVGEQASIDQGVMMEIESGLWDRVIFKLNDQVRLVETSFDVAKVQKTVLSKGKIPESVKPQKCHFLVYRMEDKPHVQLVGRPEAKAMKFAWSEMTFIKICERIASEEGLPMDEVIQQSFSFIHRWAGLGLVKAFEFKAPTDVVCLEGTAWDPNPDVEI